MHVSSVIRAGDVLILYPFLVRDREDTPPFIVMLAKDVRGLTIVAIMPILLAQGAYILHLPPSPSIEQVVLLCPSLQRLNLLLSSAPISLDIGVDVLKDLGFPQALLSVSLVPEQVLLLLIDVIPLVFDKPFHPHDL